MAPTAPHSFSTPSKQVRNEHINGFPDTPWRQATNSPSLQLLLELSRQSEEYNRDLNLRLDQEAFEREKQHRLDLEAAAEEHQRVRQSAQRAQERKILEAQRERHEREVEEQRALDREKQEQAEREIAARRQELQDARRLEDQRQIAEKTRLEAEAENRRREEKQRQDEIEAARRREEEQRQAAERAKEERVREEQRRNSQKQIEVSTTTSNAMQQKSSQSSQAPTSTVKQSSPAQTETHQAFLDLHKRLKEFRKSVEQRLKQNLSVKNQIGESRREIRKCMGQLNGERKSTLAAIAKIRENLEAAKRIEEPGIDVRQFLISPIPAGIDMSNTLVSPLMVYLLNILAKAVISQFVDEAGVAPKTADPPGVVAITIFSDKRFCWQGVTLMDILLAKYHAQCPVLWGVYGSEKTEQGRARLGWKREEGAWVSEQRHNERMTGFGAGFSALALRDFTKSSNTNPFPHTNFWKAMACILNTPPDKITQTHLIVLKAMFDNSISLKRFIGFYGQAAIASLRKAFVEFPRLAPNSAASSALATMPTIIKRDLGMTL